MTILAFSSSRTRSAGTSSRRLVVGVGVVGLEEAEAVLDRDPGGHDQEAAGEALGVGVPDGIDGLPGDQHRHHGGLAGTGGELEGQPAQQAIMITPNSIIIHRLEVVEEPLAVLADLGRHFGEPDGGLDRLDLAEERPDPLESGDAASAAGAGRSRGSRARWRGP